MKILFLLAHPDDEAYGPYGTIINHVRAGDSVSVYSVCDGSRPGSEHVAAARQKTFADNITAAGAQWMIWSNPDLTLDIRETTQSISKLIEVDCPDIVYTHNIGDLNRDHRILAEATLVGCRPKTGSTVQQLLFFEIPAGTDWAFNQFTSFEPTVYKYISDEVMDLKKSALNKYTSETYDFPDARSVESMLTLAKYRGGQVGYTNAEAFKLIFSRQ